MRRALTGGLMLAVVVVLVALLGSALHLSVLWPIVLGAAVLLVPGDHTAGRLVMLIAGAVAAWMGYALRAAVLPDLPISLGLAVAVPVLLVAVLAAATAGRLPLWAGLAGLAGFSGVYDAAFRANPTGFVADSLTAMTALLLAVALGAAAGVGARMLSGARPEPAAAESAATSGSATAILEGV
jgi:hypothetical protein